MAKIIDLGLKKADDPIFTEGIRFISIRKPTPPVGAVIPNGPCPDPITPTQTKKETPHEHSK
jgi:hypothetical protein